MNQVDQLVMLLSTDWYLPYWSTAGLFASDSIKENFKKGSRHIVDQIVAGATQYWLTDFSAKRVITTKSLFESLQSDCKVPQSFRNRILSLLKGEQTMLVDSATQWLLNRLTDSLLQRHIAEVPPPSPKLTTTIESMRKAIADNEKPAQTFQYACLTSSTQWDFYCRNLTADLPAWLADYATEICENDSFSVVWNFINANVNPDEKRELIEWYRTAAFKLTGEQLRLPREVA